jgi:hypothetical protein
MSSAATQSLRAIALVCSLKKSPAPSSSELLADQLLDQLRSAGIEGENVRRVDLVLDDVPEAVASATGNAVRNAVHLVTVLRQNAYPPYE